MPASPDFLIDGILPANEVHLLGGSSGSGKTTFMFQVFLADWQQGSPVLGHESHPVPYVYVSLDRSRSSVTRTLQRLGLEKQITRVVCQEEISERSMTIQAVVNDALKIHPDSLLIVIEGFQLLAGEKGNGYAPVAISLKKAARICSEKKITIIGICHSPKMKTDERFQHARELLIGSVSWGAFSDTIIILNLDEGTGVVNVDILPRNARSEKFELMFGDHGQLETFVKGTKRDTVCRRIEALAEGTGISRNELLQWAGNHDISERTVDDALKLSVKQKVLEPIGTGIYQRTQCYPLKIVPDSEVIVDT